MSTKNGNFILIDTLRQWGINSFTGVNGGSIVYLLQYLEPLNGFSSDSNKPYLLSLNEYIAGFVPLGYYLATGKIAACVLTTGAATKLASSGMSDSKFNNIPAVYLIGLNPMNTIHLAPLQDVSQAGMNIIAQLKAEFGASCIVVDNIHLLEQQLKKARNLLQQSRPVIFLLYPEVMAQTINIPLIPYKLSRANYNKAHLAQFLSLFPRISKNRRVILYICSEAARYPHIEVLTTEFARLLNAPTLWSVNGANAVASTNPHAYGYISFGGNDKALALWQSITNEDVLICLGFDPGEYELNLKNILAGDLWHFTNIPKAYGHLGGSFKHRVAGNYYLMRGDIYKMLAELLPQLQKEELSIKPSSKNTQLNTRRFTYQVKSSCVNFFDFYKAIDHLWQPNSIGFDDVCVAYKDRQYVTQRPNPHIKFYSLHDGSAMGHALGLGIGAKLAAPETHVFIFTGDGCWRLFGGSLAEGAKLGLRVFLINNGRYSIVDKGLEKIMPQVNKENYHCNLAPINFTMAAIAHGWMGIKLNPNLSNLEVIMSLCYSDCPQSILIEIPIDPEQDLGINNRLEHLKL